MKALVIELRPQGRVWVPRQTRHADRAVRGLGVGAGITLLLLALGCWLA